MGVVYRALDPTIGRTVAIKAIRLSEFQDPDERERIHQRLWREARSAGVLSHPHVVTIFDLVEQGSAAYIVMEYVNGPSLAQLFRRDNLPTRAALLGYLRQVANALDYAHQKGVVHRDVKPGNIIISENAVDGSSIAKVADFGVAKFISQETTHSGTMIGTPSYLSPEQIESGASDGRSDQFSLAVVIYEVLTGQKPFDSENISALFYQICKQAPKPADQLNPLLPSAASKVLARGLAKEPDQRYPSCGELISSLEAALRGPAIENSVATKPAPDHAMPVPLPTSRSRRSREDDETHTFVVQPKRQIWIGLGVAAVLVLIGFGLYQLTVRTTSVTARSQPPSKSPVVNKSPVEEPQKPLSTTVRVPAKTSAPALAESVIPVSIRTEPEGAVVQVDDRADDECTAPCTVPLTRGRHTMQATLEGYNLAKRIFNIPADKELSVILERSMGVLLLTSEPSGSTVTVDGKPSGETPITLRLTAGPHQVVLARGELRHEESITINSEEYTSRTMHWQ